MLPVPYNFRRHTSAKLETRVNSSLSHGLPPPPGFWQDSGVQYSTGADSFFLCKLLKVPEIKPFSTLLKFVFGLVYKDQGVTKRSRVSWLTNRALEDDPKCAGGGGRGV